jgi:glycosyltransferase 2 family protein
MTEMIGVSAISRTMWTCIRLAIGGAILAVLVATLGTGPFMDGLRLTSAWSLTAATAITALTTLCCAWRWRLVAAGLGVQVTPRTAVAAYYRSQFLNATLPGGILGDLHRGVSHGRTNGDIGPSLRSVAWERTLGQAVQVVLTGFVLLLLPSPLRVHLLAAAATGAVVFAGALAVLLLLLPSRLVRAVAADLRNVLRTNRNRIGIAVTSAVASLGHLVIFVIAARATGIPASAGRMLPLAAVVLLASAVPTNIAGWGPREGVAAWAFAAAGLGATAGVTTAVVYGVMALVASLPGAVVLLAGRRQLVGSSPRSQPAPMTSLVDAAHA